MFILLVRRDKPAGCLRMEVPQGKGLATTPHLTHAWGGRVMGQDVYRTNIDTFSSRLPGECMAGRPRVLLGTALVSQKSQRKGNMLPRLAFYID